jgi:hypothetical protein
MAKERNSMTEELPFPAVQQDTPAPAYDALLLQRQRLLQEEAQRVLTDLSVIEVLSAGGVVRQTGSTVLGLMVWRDIDLQVSSPGVSTARAFEIMHPLLTHPFTKHVRYSHQSDHFKLANLDERYFFMVYSERPGQAEWKLDISFWLGEGMHQEALQDAMAQELTPETRLTILRLKDVWYQLPAYRVEVASTDIDDAVLQHGVRTLTDLDQYLVERGKPPHSQGL